MTKLRIEAIAKSKGISQAKLSRLADVGMSTIQRLYHNEDASHTTVYTLQKIATALGVSVAELFEEEKPTDTSKADSSE